MEEEINTNNNEDSRLLEQSSSLQESDINVTEALGFDILVRLLDINEQLNSNSATVFDITKAINEIAEKAEEAENEYQNYPGRTAYENQREGWLIGNMIEAAKSTDGLLDEISERMWGNYRQDTELKVAFCRLLVALSYGKQPIAIDLFEAENAIDVCCIWIREAPTELRIYATGLLAVAVQDRQVADVVVKGDIPDILISRLRVKALDESMENERQQASIKVNEYVIKMASSKSRRCGGNKGQSSGIKRKHNEKMATIGTSSSTENEKKQHLHKAFGNGEVSSSSSNLAVDESMNQKKHISQELQYLDLIFTLRCLTSIGEYQEVLGPAIRRDALNSILTLFQCEDAHILLYTVALTSHLLAHKKFSLMFVESGGIQMLLNLQNHPKYSYFEGALALCLFGFASLASVMEKILSINSNVPHDFVKMAYDFLSSPQEHSRKHAVIFFGLSLYFRVVLDYFDSWDGLYKLINLMRAGLFSTTSSDRLIAHHACLCLRQYFRMNLAVLANQLRRKVIHMTGNYLRIASTSEQDTSMYTTTSEFKRISSTKAVEIDDKATASNIAVLDIYRYSHLSTIHSKWAPIQKLLHHRGTKTLLQLIDQLHESTDYRVGVLEMGQFCLETLQIVSLFPVMYSEVCETILENGRSGMSILLDCSINSSIKDPDIIRTSMHILCNCVCPHHKPTCRQHPYKDIRHFTLTSEMVSKDPIFDMDCNKTGCSCSGDNKAQRQIRKFAREKNAIKVCLQLLRYKRPNQNADEIRLLACRALLGLAKDRHICQILEKMQIGQLLSDLIRSEPFLESNAGLHMRFRECALSLISHVADRVPSAVLNEATDPTVWKIEKSSIVSRTKVTFDSKELLNLIFHHLKSHGLTKSAEQLCNEAQLLIEEEKLPSSQVTSNHTESTITQENNIPISSCIKSHPPLKVYRRRSDSVDDIPLDESERPTKLFRISALLSPEQNYLDSPKTPSLQINGLYENSSSKKKNFHPKENFISDSSKNNVPKRKTTKMKIEASHYFQKNHVSCIKGSNYDVVEKSHKVSKRSLLEKSSSPLLRKTLCTPISPFELNNPGSTKTSSNSHHSNRLPTKLDTIVTEYLREQHKKCAHPIEVLPPFSLHKEHICPEINTKKASNNIAKRLLDRQVLPPHGGPLGERFTRRLVHSRFRPCRSFRDDGVEMTVACFIGSCPSGIDEKILVGTDIGEIRCFDTNNVDIVQSWECHSGAISSISALPHSNFILTSTSSDITTMIPETVLWKYDPSSPSDGNNLTPKMTLSNVKNGSFNHFGNEFITLAGDSNRTDVFSIELERKLYSLNDSHTRNDYKFTNVCFSPTDDTILVDGTLFDRRQPRVIQKFDKLSNFGSGAFHPYGNEVIINSAVWDLRTFKLLRIIPALDQCSIKFNSLGGVLYAYRKPMDDMEQSWRRNRYNSYFHVLDMQDYREISMVDLDRGVLDITMGVCDRYIAVVEGQLPAQANSSPLTDTCCRVYAIGRQKPSDDDSDVDDGTDDADRGDDWEEDEFDEDESDSMESLSIHSSDEGRSLDSIEEDYSSQSENDESSDEGNAGHEILEEWINARDLWDSEDEQ